jgi:hypothetical protein
LQSPLFVILILHAMLPSIHSFPSLNSIKPGLTLPSFSPITVMAFGNAFYFVAIKFVDAGIILGQ